MKVTGIFNIHQDPQTQAIHFDIQRESLKEFLDAAPANNGGFVKVTFIPNKIKEKYSHMAVIARRREG